MKAIWPRIQEPWALENRLDQFGLEDVWGQAVDCLQRSLEFKMTLSIITDGLQIGDLCESQTGWPGMWMSTIKWIKRCVNPICKKYDS